jgi:hypothetical protein
MEVNMAAKVGDTRAKIKPGVKRRLLSYQEGDSIAAA